MRRCPSRLLRPRALALLALAALASRALPAGAQTGYIAFGDSITEGRGDDPTRQLPGYPPRLQALLIGAGIPVTVKNAGLGGESTAEGLTRIDEVLAVAGPLDDVLLLMEGTNDFANHIGIETTRFDLNAMAQKAEAKGMSVVHATTIPRLPDAKFDPDNVMNLTLNENIRDMAGRRSRTLADPFEVFSSLPNLFDTYYYKPPTGQNDPVGHPNAAGYDKLAQLFFDELRDVDKVPPVPGITNPLMAAEAVPPTSPITVDVWDFGAGIDLAATRLLVNGTEVGVVPAGDSHHAQLNYVPTTSLAGIVRVALRSRDLALPTANTTDREVTRFIVAGTIILAGDVDRSGRVDGRDLVQFARHFGARKGDTLYLALADFNADTVIDGSDLAQLAANFGKQSF
ncbi:MAG TPA: GDSL-type esterase/lipase family protein [Thermoanaerobaculia bacterium]|nr:GDSL-type esterase/lipase family protein [Thermoanaerobaculia bacterium]